MSRHQLLTTIHEGNEMKGINDIQLLSSKKTYSLASSTVFTNAEKKYTQTRKHSTNKENNEVIIKTLTITPSSMSYFLRHNKGVEH